MADAAVDDLDHRGVDREAAQRDPHRRQVAGRQDEDVRLLVEQVFTGRWTVHTEHRDGAARCVRVDPPAHSGMRVVLCEMTGSLLRGAGARSAHREFVAGCRADDNERRGLRLVAAGSAHS